MKTAEEILLEELSEDIFDIIEQKDKPEELRYFKKYIIDAMEEYAEQFKLKQPPVSGRVCFSPDCFYHDKTTDTCVGDYAKCTVKQTHR